MGLEEDSIIVFTSDHGELFGAHGRRAKNIFYEEAVRVPFLVKWKGEFSEGVKRDFVFNTVDIMPSFLTLMGLPVPEETEGKDLSQCIRGQADTQEGALMMCTGPTAVFGDGNEWRAYRTREFTYAVFKADGMELLFDNQKDPYQMHNLVGDPAYGQVMADLKSRMYAEMERINDHFENNTYYEKNWVENRLIKRTATLKG